MTAHQTERQNPVKMTVREVIRRLEAAAQQLPRGLDTPVIVMLCDGTNAEGSREIEIDMLTWYNKATGEQADDAAMIKGHPHIDRDEGDDIQLRGVVQSADEALRDWTSRTDGPGDDSASSHE